MVSILFLLLRNKIKNINHRVTEKKSQHREREINNKNSVKAQCAVYLSGRFYVLSNYKN